MKAVKESNKVVQGKGFSVSWAGGHVQHVLNKHDRDTKHDDHLVLIVYTSVLITKGEVS